MQFTVFERLFILNVLPAEGSIMALRVMHNLKMELSFTDEELAALNFETKDDGRIIWQPVVPPKEIILGDKAREIVQKAIKARAEQLDKEEHMTNDVLALVDKLGITFEENAEQPTA